MEERSRTTPAHPDGSRNPEAESVLLLGSITDYAIFMLDADGCVVSWNKGAERLKGYRADEIVGQHFSRFYPEEDVAGGKPAIELRVAASEGRFEEEGWRVRKDGSLFWANVIITPIRDEAGGLRGFSKITRDVTERHHTEESLRQAEERYRRIFEEAVIGIFQTTPEGRYLSANPALAEIFGFDSPSELIASRSDSAHQGYVDPRQWEMFKSRIEELGTLHDAEYQAYRKDGSKIWLLENARVVRDSSGATLYYEGTLTDITDRKVAEERIHYLAFHDDLTGLANRTLLLDRLRKAIARSQRNNDKVAILFLDLDQFKFINDSFGHSVGDLLLQEVAKRLESLAREQDTVARLSGDEFVVMLPGVKESFEAGIAATRFLDAITTSFDIRGQVFLITCSVGICMFPEHGLDGETLIKNADAAMYIAKEWGRNNFQFFTEDLNDKAVELLKLGSGLRVAVEKQELFLMYQPQVDLGSGQITGLEALLRWQSPEFGLVSPDRFIPIAENSGLIVSIGEWALRTACFQIRKWQDEGLLTVPIAVNVSAVQFRQRGFTKLIGEVLLETGIASKYLELELTESLLLSTGEMTFAILRELKAMGVSLVIDDFGTGYSSLSYLKHFPIDKLKIDQSSIRDVAENPDDAAITTAIIGIAKQLKLKVIAEGVDDKAQISFLQAHQCDEIQGYYFSRPLTADAAAQKLRAT
jgi:diguanylate cyclase (GGDEF)-like protein/PAS domain S-box-containing protein